MAEPHIYTLAAAFSIGRRHSRRGGPNQPEGRMPGPGGHRQQGRRIPSSSSARQGRRPTKK